MKKRSGWTNCTKEIPTNLPLQKIWLQLEQGMAEVDVMMRNLRASLWMTPAVTPTTSSRRTGSSGAGNGSGDQPMEYCATPGISGTSEGQFGPREVPDTIAKQLSGSIVMPPPSFPVDLSTPIRQGGRVGKHELPSTNSGNTAVWCRGNCYKRAVATRATCGRHDD